MGRAFKARIDDDAIKLVQITISAATSGVSSADPQLVGGRVLSIVPTSSGGQIIVSVALGATGIVTVTIAGSDTATYDVYVQKA